MMDRIDYNQIFENGVRHIEGAKLLAEINMFGFAISHLILGIEELIKYQVVMTKSVNKYSFDDVIDPQQKKSIFRNHLTKHDLIKEFLESTSSEFANEFFNKTFQRLTGQISSEDNSPILKNRFKEWGAFFAFAGADLNISEEKRDDFFAWLKNANSLKNKGFYVNWENKFLETPNSMTLDDYQAAFSYASVILKQTEFMKSVDLSDKGISALLNSDRENQSH
jgi:AbiV family abortive infection protein